MSKTVKIIEAIKFINKYNIQNATPTDEGQINVDGDVNLSNKNLTDPDMTAKFGKVTGNFECSNNQLTNLDFAPDFVGGNFNCSNNNIKDFDDIPIRHVVGNFYAYGADPDKLSKLESIVEGKIYPSH